MNIYITGIAGFLGSHIAKKMLLLGHNVFGNDNMIGGEKLNLPQGVRFDLTDCCDQRAMSENLKDMDIVYHCAATAHEGLSVFSPSFITRNIYEASVSTISAAIHNKVKKFVFCSSMARYGSQATPFHEDMEPKPQDPYGIAKVAAEDTLKILCEVHGMEWNIAVPHNIIGPNQKFDDPYRNVLSIFINRNLRNLPAIIYGDGKQIRCFSYIDDCVYCLEKIGLDPHIKSQIINIGPDEGSCNIEELAHMVAVETHFHEPPIYMPDRPQEVKDAVCSANKARQLLHYKTKTSLKDAIHNTAEYIKQMGPRPFAYEYPLEIVTEKTPKTWSKKLM